MESDADSRKNRNDALSQSYSQGIERVAQQNNEGVINFELPKEVLEKREKEWGNFYNKFNKEVPDDIELNIDTMEPIADEEEDDDDEDEEDEYYAKCRAPMRKLPALIQHWIDTGNPPYQLHDDDGHSETGSSLSEGEHSRSGQSTVLKESSEKFQQPEENSPYSSVDTAAYILSNTNVTKKADTLVIVDGAKNGDKTLMRKPSPLIGNVAEHRSTNTANSKCADRNTLNNKNILSPSKDASPNAHKSAVSNTEGSTMLLRVPSIVYQPEKSLTLTPKKDSRPIVNADSSPSKLSQSSSVKLSEVLPTLQQFDEFLEKSETTPRTRLSVAKDRQPKEFVAATVNTLESREMSQCSSQKSSENSSQNSSQNFSQDSAILPNGLQKLHNRRTLYTGRNSPVDVMEIRTSTESALPSGLSWHPALEPITITDRTKIFVNRARARRKRKRASQNTESSSQDGNTSQDSSVPIVPNNSSKGNMRYTDFFESLGLTPSKTIIGKVRSKPLSKRLKKNEERNDTNKVKRKQEFPGASNKPNKSSPNSLQTAENSMVSQSSKTARIDAGKIPGKFVEDKIVKVRIVRFTEEDLARYQRRDTSSRDGKKSKTLTKSDNRAKESSESFNKKKRNSNQPNVELLTMNAHDSDSSTILLCKCTNDIHNQFSESDASLCVKQNLQLRKKKQQQKEQTLTTKNYESEQESTQIHQSSINVSKSQDLPVLEKVKMTPKKMETPENIKVVASSNSPKLFVRLERLDSEKLANLTKKIDENNDPGLTKASESSNKKNIDSKDKSTEIVNDNKKSVSLIRTNSNELLSDSTDKYVSIGSKDSAELNKSKFSGKQRKSQKELRLRLSSSSDEEDIFVKLNQQTELNRRKSKIKNGLINEKEEAKPDDRLDESNRRKLIISDKRDSSSDDEAKSAKGKKRRTESLRRSTRICGNNEGITQESNNLSTSIKWKCKRNLFAPLEQSNLSDEKVSLTDKTRESETSIKKSRKEFGSPTVLLSNEFKDRMKSFKKTADAFSAVSNKRSTLCDGKIVADTICFQTRIDDDWDTESERSKFILSKETSVSSRKTSSNGKKSTASNEEEDSSMKTSSMTQKSIRNLRSSLRRSINNSIIKKTKETDESEEKEPKNISIEDSKNTSNGCTRTTRKIVASSPIKRLSLRKNISSPGKLNKPPSFKVKRRHKLSSDSLGNNGLRRRSEKFEQLTKNGSKNSPTIKNLERLTKNGSKNSSIIKKSSHRRSKIANNSEYLNSTKNKWKTQVFKKSSDDDSDDDLIRHNLSKSSSTKALGESSSRKTSPRFQRPNKLSIKDASEKNSRIKLRDRSKNLFSNNLTDATDDDELLFVKDSKIPSLATVVMENLNFSTKIKKLESINNNKESVMRFRTKIRYDSDDDNDL